MINLSTAGLSRPAQLRHRQRACQQTADERPRPPQALQFGLIGLAAAIAVLEIPSTAAQEPPRFVGASPAWQTGSISRAHRAPIGRIRISRGKVSIHRAGSSQNASTGTLIQRGDRIQTSQHSRAIIELDDESRIQLGENTRLRLSHFTKEKRMRKGAVLIRLSTGTIRFKPAPPRMRSSKRAEIQSEAAKIEGTSYDTVVSLKAHKLSLVILDGAVAVRNNAGSVEIMTPGHGIDAVTAGTPPGPAVPWHSDRVRKSLLETKVRRKR